MSLLTLEASSEARQCAQPPIMECPILRSATPVRAASNQLALVAMRSPRDGSHHGLDPAAFLTSSRP